MGAIEHINNLVKEVENLEERKRNLKIQIDVSIRKLHKLQEDLKDLNIKKESVQEDIQKSRGDFLQKMDEDRKNTSEKSEKIRREEIDLKNSKDYFMMENDKFRKKVEDFEKEKIKILEKEKIIKNAVQLLEKTEI